jgi:hypothetical protein
MSTIEMVNCIKRDKLISMEKNVQERIAKYDSSLEAIDSYVNQRNTLGDLILQAANTLNCDVDSDTNNNMVKINRMDLNLNTALVEDSSRLGVEVDLGLSSGMTDANAMDFILDTPFMSGDIFDMDSQKLTVHPSRNNEYGFSRYELGNESSTSEAEIASDSVQEDLTRPESTTSNGSEAGNNKLEFTTTNLQKKKLCYQGYYYTISRVIKNSDKIAWRCENRLCRGRITTIYYESVYKTGTHNHIPNFDRKVALQNRGLILFNASSNLF